MDKRRILGKLLNALGWLVVICLVGYGMLYVKDNINTLEGPVWDYVRKETGTPSNSYMEKLKGSARYTAEGAIQSIDENGFVISMLATMDAPPGPAGISFEGPVNHVAVMADGGNGIYSCTLADKVLVEYYESSTSGEALGSEIMPKAEAMKLLKPGLVVDVGSHSGDATNINQVIYINILIGGFVQGGFDDRYVDPDPGYVDIMTSKTTKHPKWMYRRQ